jgi:hypothetical protein
MEQKVPNLTFNSILKLPTVKKGYVFTDRRETDKIHVKVTPFTNRFDSENSPGIRVRMNDSVMSERESKRFLMSRE